MKYSQTIGYKPLQRTIERIEANVQDTRFLAQCANNPPGDSSAWNIVGCMARELLRLRGIEWDKVEYRAANYQGSGRTAIMMADRVLRMEDGLPIEPVRNESSPWRR